MNQCVFNRLAMAVLFLFCFFEPNETHAQEELLIGQEIRVQINGVEVNAANGQVLRGLRMQAVDGVLVPVMPPDAELSKRQLFMLMRGLIQNELSVVDSVCQLDDKQRQAIVDLAEQEWTVKTSAAVLKCLQQHVFGTNDLDSLAERTVRSWLVTCASTESVANYDQELADRMEYRKHALISVMLDSLVAKLNLSSAQMEQIEAILDEKWRDRWFRSLEATFNNVSLFPEIKPSWISSILTDAQQAALVTRESQQFFGSHQVTQDSPSLALDARFVIGSIASSNAIELAMGSKKEVKASKSEEQNDATKR
ncbi:MAG: hypothetical protein NTU79_13435 [Planctomycetota bacterium]|nr:hypothetical protein [Planctomycetota bacterium]